ncbi:hypothetical protein [Paraburkholderia sp. DHOC27]|uniref:hypothetical protein n=1 Tax=Paraburkholderia sp. DHOC27 TaxID=2303330 RepID=UPI000E3BA10B|nr:hypothetical protein [Paraburkholderia sp. DHOC27]RFU45649.1 hypothetical protein D0B32_23975 [Paraburkholderia sp. DHOC27]
MNLHLIYLFSVASVAMAAAIGYRTYHLQRHIRQELRALRVQTDAKALQAKVAATVASVGGGQTGYGPVTNAESGFNAYGFAPVNRSVEIRNSYSL